MRRVRFIQDKVFEGRFKSGPSSIPTSYHTYIFLDCNFNEELEDIMRNYYNDSLFINCTLGEEKIPYQIDHRLYKGYYDE